MLENTSGILYDTCAARGIEKGEHVYASLCNTQRGFVSGCGRMQGNLIYLTHRFSFNKFDMDMLPRQGPAVRYLHAVMHTANYEARPASRACTFLTGMKWSGDLLLNISLLPMVAVAPIHIKRMSRLKIHGRWADFLHGGYTQLEVAALSGRPKSQNVTTAWAS